MRTYKELLKIQLKLFKLYGGSSCYYTNVKLSAACNSKYGVITSEGNLGDNGHYNQCYRSSEGATTKVLHMKCSRLRPMPRGVRGQDSRSSSAKEKTKCQHHDHRKRSPSGSYIKEQHGYKDYSLNSPLPPPPSPSRFTFQQTPLSDLPPPTTTIPSPNLDLDTTIIIQESTQPLQHQQPIVPPIPLSPLKKVPCSEKNIQILRFASYNVRTLQVKKAYSTMSAKPKERPEDKRQPLILQMRLKEIEVMCLQEVRCTMEQTVEPFCLDGYSFFYSTTEESAKLGRYGVGIVMCDSLLREIDEVYPVSDRTLIITGTFKHRKFAIISTYAPTNSSSVSVKNQYYEELSIAISKLPSCYRRRLIFGGDFNARIGGVHECCGKFNMKGETNNNGERLLDFCLTQDLIIGDTLLRPTVRRKEGTWYHSPSKKWFIIDHILASKVFRKQITKCQVDGNFELWSDHRAVVADFQLVKQLTQRMKWNRKAVFTDKEKKRKLVDYGLLKESDQVCFLEEAGAKMDALLKEERVKFPHKEVEWETILKFIKECEKDLPELGPSPRIYTDWFDQHRVEMEKLFQERARLYAKACKKRSSNKERKDYKVHKKLCQKVIRQRQNKFYINTTKGILEESRNHHNKTFYELIKTRYGAKNITSSGSALLKKDGTLTKNNKEKQDRQVEHANELLNQESIANPDIDCFLTSLNQEEIIESLGKEFTITEWCTAAALVKGDKALGLDETPIEFVHMIISLDFHKALLAIINKNLREGSTQQSMKDAIIIFIHKKGNTNNTNNFRTVSLLSHIGKIQDRLMLERLYVEAEKRNWYGVSQQGFRKEKGVGDAYLIMNMMDNYILEKGMFAAKIFVDNTKAYDMVVRDLLWVILKRRGVPDILINLIKSTLVGAKAFVRTGGMLVEHPFELKMGLKQGAILSCFLFNIFMGAILQEIRKRLLADQPDGTFPELRFNFNCNPLERNSAAREGGGVMSCIDILFADDSVFYVILSKDGDDTNIRVQRAINVINEVMKAFGQKVNAPKTEVSVIARNKEDSDKLKSFLDIKLDDIGIKVVDEFKYVGSRVTGDCTNTKEIKIRRGMMEASFKRHVENMFTKNRLDLVYSITMFKVFIVSNGVYNCAAWTAGTPELLTLNTTARSILMRIFGFKWYHHVSYDYLVKLCRLMGCHMYPIHLFVKMQRLSFFGHIIRMDNDSLPKKLLFGEIVGGKRAQGRPTPSWIDRVKEDLHDFGLDPKDWIAIKSLALDRIKWRKAIKTDGVERAYKIWLSDNTTRRSIRMIKEGVQIISPIMDLTDALANVRESSKKVTSLINLLERTPLSNLPNNILVNITAKLGPIKSMEILEASNRVHAGIRNRDMNENEETWEKPYITDLRNQCIEFDKIQEEFKVIVMQRQSWYDQSDIDDESVKFEIMAVVGYVKRGKKDFYKVVWKPRSLCANKTYPDFFPELQGKAWPLNDDNNWIGSSSDYWNTIKKGFEDIMVDLKGWHNNKNNERGLELVI